MTQKTITLVRHGHAALYAENDYRRPLTMVGKKQAEQLGNFLKETLIPYQIIFASAAARTLETAQIIADLLGYDAKIWSSQAWYSASLSQIVPALEELPEHIHHCLLVLHGPTVQAVGAWLTGQELGRVQVGSAFVIELKRIYAWHEIILKRGKLLHAYAPGDLLH